jgi:hypothetical protein
MEIAKGERALEEQATGSPTFTTFSQHDPTIFMLATQYRGRMG